MTGLLREPDGRCSLMFDETPWCPPAWYFHAGFSNDAALRKYFNSSVDRIRQAERDGIPQVAPILVAFRADLAECRARIGKSLWRQVHHSSVMHNAWRARIALQTRLSFPAIMVIPTGALREIIRAVSVCGHSAVEVAAHIATNRNQMRVAAMLVRDVMRMGGNADRRWSLRRLREEHDRLAYEYARRRVDPTPWAEPWQVDIDGFRFTRLVSDADFASEGAVMHHCIASYASMARDGMETAFRIEGRERASVSFSAGHTEIRSYHNAAVSKQCRDAAHKAWAIFRGSK